MINDKTWKFENTKAMMKDKVTQFVDIQMKLKGLTNLIGSMIYSMKFLSPEVLLISIKSAI